MSKLKAYKPDDYVFGPESDMPELFKPIGGWPKAKPKEKKNG